jgi:NAD(P)H-nitrite reductase large subunit
VTKLKYLILGFGAAGANAAEALRNRDSEAEVTILDGEGRSFYLRLDLEGVFQGKPREQLQPRSPDYWKDRSIKVIPDRASKLDVRNRLVATESGQELPFDRLLIATGGTPRRLAIPGAVLPGVVHYHTLSDAEKIMAAKDKTRRAVIVGGGILGLELAHAGVDFGWEVTLLVRGPYVGSPIAEPKGSAIVQRALESRGVRIIFEDEAAEFEGETRLRRVRTKRGRVLEADLAAVCIGIEPDLAFLSDSGLLTDGQLIVDDYLCAGHPEVFAAGDAAVVRKNDGRLVACHTWHVASAQGRAAIANLCGDNAPWRENILYNLDFLFDQEFSMIGPWDDRHLPGRMLHEFPSDTVYRALVTNAGVLESALLLGKREGDRQLRKLISNRTRIEGNVERMFDSNQ